MKHNNIGLYIVTLTNEVPISVNAHDPRLAEKAIKVNKSNLKFGKAKDFDLRKKNYFKTFGEANVNFRPFIAMDEIDLAEKLILKNLDPYRVRGNTGKKNEWLTGITVSQLEKVILDTLQKENLKFALIK